jgi:hypothetical protein
MREDELGILNLGKPGFTSKHCPLINTTMINPTDFT